MEYVLNACSFLLQPSTLIVVFLGMLVGLLFGIIPGLNGSLAIMLMMPISYGMSSELAIAFLMAVYIGGTCGGCIAAIMIGIPGTNASIATVYDGYEMTKNGEVVRALSAAIVANAFGTIPAVLVALVASKAIASIAIYMGPWEIFSLGMCAIVMVATLAKDNLVKGLLAAGMGLAFSTVGTSPLDGTFRYVFGNYNLYGGLNMVYVIMGIFASRIILLEYARHNSAQKQKLVEVERFCWPTRDIAENKRNIFESWMIGLWTGFLPGIGPGLANLAAYARAKSTSKHPEQFGHGCVDGIFAPEVANNASLGGAMIPMIALGIPGDTGTAYLLGALMLHGLEPGPLLFTTNPNIVNIVFFASILAAILALISQIAGMKIFPKALNIPYHYLYPAIILCCFIGVFSSQKTLFAVMMLLIFSAFGIFIAFANLPTAPFVLAFVLGGVLETNFRRGLTYASNGVWSFLTRPVSAFLLLVALSYILTPCLKNKFSKKKLG